MLLLAMRGAGFYAVFSCFYYVPLTRRPVPTSAFFSLSTNTEHISMKSGEVITTTNRWSDYILGEIKQRPGNKVRKKFRIDVKLVLPHSERLNKFHSTYGTLCPQGWRVHYTYSGGGIIWPNAVVSYLVCHCNITGKPHETLGAIALA